MAKAKVLDNKLVIESDVFTNENLDLVSIYKPSALVLSDEETKSVMYQVSKGEISSVTKYGCVFKNGKAVADLDIDPEEKELIKASISMILMKLNLIEDTVKKALKDVSKVDVDVEFLD